MNGKTLLGKLRIKKGKNPLGRVIENTAWLLAGKGFGGLLSLVYLAIVTRTLGIDGFGRFTLIFGTAVAISTFVRFETWQVILRFGAEHLHQKRVDEFGRLVAVAILFDFGGAFLGCGIAWLVTRELSPVFGWDESVSKIALFYCFASLLAINSAAMGVLRAFNRFDLGAYADSVVPIVRFAGSVVLLFVGPSLEGFLIVWGASEVLSSATYWYLAKKTGGDVMRARYFLEIVQGFRSQPGLSGFLFITNIGVTLTGVVKQFPVLIIGMVGTAASAGLFRLASQISQAMSKISFLLSRSIFAELAQVRASQTSADLRKLFRKTTKLTFYAGLVLMALVILLGKPILLLIAGRDFLPAYPLLVIIGSAAAVEFIGVAFEPALLSGSAARQVLAVRFLFTAILILLYFLLLPHLGATGVALAILGYTILTTLVLGILAYIHINDHELKDSLADLPAQLQDP